MKINLFNEDNVRWFIHLGLSKDTEDTSYLDLKTCYYLTHRLLRILKRDYKYDACVILCPFSINYHEKDSGNIGRAGGVTNRDLIYMPTTLNSYKDFVEFLIHEYMHVIQWNEKVKFNHDKIWADRNHEIEANKFADKFMESFKF